MRNLVLFFLLIIINGCTIYHSRTEIRPALWTVQNKLTDSSGLTYVQLVNNDNIVFDKLLLPENCINVINVGSTLLIEQEITTINGVRSVQLNVNEIEKSSCFGYIR